MVYLLIPLLGQLGCCAEPFIVMYGCIVYVSAQHCRLVLEHSNDCLHGAVLFALG